MTTIQPIDGDAWTERGEIVPAGAEQDSRSLPEEYFESEYQWAAEEEAVPYAGRYVVVAALRGPEAGAAPRYFVLSLPEEYEAGKALGRALAGPVGFLERALGPLGRRLGRTWKDTTARFVSLGDLAAELQVDPAKVSAWRDEPGFPPAVLERGENPLFVREEVEEWLEARPDRPGSA